MFITGHLSDISISRVDTKAPNSISTRFYYFNLTLIITINFITFGTFKEIMLYKLYNFNHFKCKIGEQKCPDTFDPIYKYDEAVPLWMKRQKIGQSVHQDQ